MNPLTDGVGINILALRDVGHWGDPHLLKAPDMREQFAVKALGPAASRTAARQRGGLAHRLPEPLPGPAQLPPGKRTGSHCGGRYRRLLHRVRDDVGEGEPANVASRDCASPCLDRDLGDRRRLGRHVELDDDLIAPDAVIDVVLDGGRVSLTSNPNVGHGSNLMVCVTGRQLPLRQINALNHGPDAQMRSSTRSAVSKSARSRFSQARERGARDADHSRVEVTRFLRRGTLTFVEDDSEERRDAVVTPATIHSTARVNPVRIFIRPHLWPTWAEIAIDEMADARVARQEMKRAAEEPGKQGLGELLGKELKASLVSIAAASHSLDALYGVLVEMVVEPELREKWREKRVSGKKGPPRHRQVYETIRRAVVADAETLKRWTADFEWLFDLRDAAVHHKEEAAQAVPHPSGTTSSSEIYLSYCVETAGRAVDLLLEVLTQVVTSPRPNRADVVKWAGDMTAIVDTRAWGIADARPHSAVLTVGH